MNRNKATGRIKMIRVPKGEAPLWVRKGWVGLTLPCHPICGFPSKGIDRGVVSGKRAKRNRYGFSVPQDEGLAALEQKDPEAAAYWKRLGLPKRGQCFGFAENEAKILSGVTRQTIVEVADEMMGDTDR